MNTEERGANNWVGVLIIAVVVLGAFLFVSRWKYPSLPDLPTPTPASELGMLPIFAEGPTSQGIAAETIGFHSFSPDGNYFFFNAFVPNGTPTNQAYLVSIADGAIKKLPGVPQRGFEDSRVLQLSQPGGIVLYWPKTGVQRSYTVSDAFLGALSPNGATYIVNTSGGVKKINIETGAIETLAVDRYDGAYAWLSDGNRIVGFRHTDENLFEAGKARELGIWNIDDGSFESLSIAIEPKSVRSVEWVIPDKIVRVNAGYDDGSFDFLVNISTKEVANVGDTSGALMGGTRTDVNRGLFAVVEGDDASSIGSRALLYKGMEKQYDLALPKGYFREQMQIVDEHRLVYLRKQWTDTEVTSQQLVSLDLRNGEETVLHELAPRDYASLSLSPDHMTWVLSQGGQFIIGTV